MLNFYFIARDTEKAVQKPVFIVSNVDNLYYVKMKRHILISIVQRL